MSTSSAPLYDIEVKNIAGQRGTLRPYAGKVLLIVNVASKCGLTPQYTALQQLHTDYAERGLVVLGFPANDFAGQEPGSDADIASFCDTQYKVSFPLFSKLVATGADKHPLYAWLTQAHPDTSGRAATENMLSSHGITPTAKPEIVWNFEKFVVGRDGRVVARLSPMTDPAGSEVRAAIEQALDA
ncbi:MAG: glutathione peroxidase [Rhodocyclaceae bacterium]